MQLSPGVYELVITKAVQAALETLPSELMEVVKLDPAEAHRVLARHVSTILERVLHQQGVQAEPEERLSLQLRLCGRVLELLEHAEEEPVGSQLVAIVGRDPTGVPARPWIRPSTPLSDSALLVNANHEPNIGHELEREIESADSIDLLCAFIKWQGLRLLLASLRRFIERGGRLRVLTSTYLGVTEVRPLDMLREIGGHVRVTYETDATRLHAKAWLFHRESGFTTAYIGSSNLSHSALIDGLEWNVRSSRGASACSSQSIFSTRVSTFPT